MAKVKSKLKIKGILIQRRNGKIIRKRRLGKGLYNKIYNYIRGILNK